MRLAKSRKSINIDNFVAKSPQNVKQRSHRIWILYECVLLCASAPATATADADADARVSVYVSVYARFLFVCICIAYNEG